MINWDNFCTYIIMRFQEQDLSNSTREIPFIAKPRIIRFPNIKVRWFLFSYDECSVNDMLPRNLGRNFLFGVQFLHRKAEFSIVKGKA